MLEEGLLDGDDVAAMNLPAFMPSAEELKEVGQGCCLAAAAAVHGGQGKRDPASTIIGAMTLLTYQPNT